jgi:hypothetical protein
MVLLIAACFGLRREPKSELVVRRLHSVACTSAAVAAAAETGGYQALLLGAHVYKAGAEFVPSCCM